MGNCRGSRSALPCAEQKKKGREWRNRTKKKKGCVKLYTHPFPFSKYILVFKCLFSSAQMTAFTIWSRAADIIIEDHQNKKRFNQMWINRRWTGQTKNNCQTQDQPCVVVLEPGRRCCGNTPCASVCGKSQCKRSSWNTTPLTTPHLCHQVPLKEQGMCVAQVLQTCGLAMQFRKYPPVL